MTRTFTEARRDLQAQYSRQGAAVAEVQADLTEAGDGVVVIVSLNDGNTLTTGFDWDVGSPFSADAVEFGIEVILGLVRDAN